MRKILSDSRGATGMGLIGVLKNGKTTDGTGMSKCILAKFLKNICPLNPSEGHFLPLVIDEMWTNECLKPLENSFDRLILIHSNCQLSRLPEPHPSNSPDFYLR